MQAEEQARHFEREFVRMKKALELETVKFTEESRKNTALMTQIATVEREKARLMAEVRMAKVAGGSDGEIRREKSSVDLQIRDRREIDTQRDADLAYRDRIAQSIPRPLESDLLSPSFQGKKQSMDRFPVKKETGLDTVPSRDSRLMIGLKQRIALVKDQLENEFQSPKGTI